MILKNFRLKLATFLVGGTLHNFEGRSHAGIWHEGEIILTRKGKEAMDASFWHDAKVFSDTALTDYRPRK